MSFVIDFGTLTKTGFGIDFSLGGGGSTGQIKVWNGSTWVVKPMKVYLGSWQVKPVKYWNGSSWVITPY